MKTSVVFLTFSLVATVGVAERSRAVPRDFQRANPCPSTGLITGPCPGYVRDHIVPRCAGGPDRPRNMRWQTVADGLAKDRVERRACTPQRLW